MTQLAAEQRAWRLLLASFATFVILCSALLYGIYWFLFQSTVQMAMSLTAARGTIRVTTPDSQEAVAKFDERVDVETGTIIETDATSQAVVSFADSDTGEILGYLFVMRDSQVELTRAQTPRFSLNTADNEIQVTSAKGKSYMVLVDDGRRPVHFVLSSPHGAVTTSSSGEYVIEVTEAWTKVSVQNGEITLTASSNDSPLLLSNNQHAYMASGLQPQHPAVDKSLVGNSQFTEIYSSAWDAYSEGDPAGVISNSDFQGRPVITFDRGQERWPDLILDHGVTGLVQDLNLDLGNIDSLELQASFYVQQQSLSTCGVDGSECPLMLRVDYTDSGGAERVYRHGFYAVQDPGNGFPLLCDTCRFEHERIRMQTWYTYTDNLFAVLPQDQRPQFINKIWLYASGHAYVVHIAQLDLVASRLRPPNAGAK